jgi:DNA replication protein DnaC
MTMTPFSSDAWRQRLEALARTPAATASKPVNCASCEDTRFVRTDDNRFAPCSECNSVRVSGLPKEFETVTLRDLRLRAGNRAAIERARRFVVDERDLYIHGPIGVGKTMLACATAQAFVATTRRPALFVRWPRMLHQLRPGLPDAARGCLEERLSTMPLLILDDIGAERDVASDYSRRTILQVYETRTDAGLLTLFTSNLSLDELAAHEGDDRLTSRICGRASIVTITGADERRRLRAV